MEAKILIKSISKDHGHIDEISLGKSSHDVCQTSEALLTQNAEAGNASSLLVQNVSIVPLAESQPWNAAENILIRARVRKEGAFMTFKVAPSYIPLECSSEDGFAPALISALCAVDKSSNHLIFLPIDGKGRGRRKEPDHCRSDTPKNMKSLFGLRAYCSLVIEEKNQLNKILSFTRYIAGVPDLPTDEIVPELCSQKESHENGDFNRELYKWLPSLSSTHAWSEKKSLREPLRLNTRIFAEGKWHFRQRPWSNKTNASNVIDLSHHYPDMEMVVAATLGFPMLARVYNEPRIEGAPQNTTVDRFKQELWPSIPPPLTALRKLDSRSILEIRIFPDKCPDGSVQPLSTASTGFTGVEKRVTEGKVLVVGKMLGFVLNELHHLRSLLNWTDLNVRRLFGNFTESIVQNGANETIRELQHHIISRAYSLYQIITQLGNPREDSYMSLCQLLKAFKDFKVPSILSKLCLAEYARKVRANGVALNFSVSTDILCRGICHLVHLPNSLFRRMMDYDSLALEARANRIAMLLTNSVFHTEPSSARFRESVFDLHFPVDSDTIAQLTLLAETKYSRKGSHSVNSPVTLSPDRTRGDTTLIVDKERNAKPPTRKFSAKVVSEHRSGRSNCEEQSAEAPNSVHDGGERVILRAPVLSVASVSTHTSQTQASNAEDLSSISSSETTEASTPPRLGTWRWSVPPFQPMSSGPLRQETFPETELFSFPYSSPIERTSGAFNSPEYLALLEMIIKKAQTASFPRKVFDMSGIKQSLVEGGSDQCMDDYWNGFEGVERRKRIGAAGELYVFELLSAIRPRLPAFSRDVWMSSVRNYVAAHPNYRGMSSWFGGETADIVYNDSAGILTAALIDHGYLDGGRWRGRTPRYYIEVKTTVGKCELPFYLTDRQYTRMREMSRTSHDDDGREAIFIIFRVFYLGKESPGEERMSCKVYVDPASLVTQGVLKSKCLGTYWLVVEGDNANFQDNLTESIPELEA